MSNSYRHITIVVFISAVIAVASQGYLPFRQAFAGCVTRTISRSCPKCNARITMSTQRTTTAFLSDPCNEWPFYNAHCGSCGYLGVYSETTGWK